MVQFGQVVEKQYDIVVVGGGTSGAAAAVTAAKTGKKVALVEEQGFLGGTSTGGMISQYMGFADGIDSENVFGTMGEILRRLWVYGAAGRIETIQLLYREDLAVKAASYDSEVAKLVLDELVQEAGVNVLLHTRALGVEMAGGAIDSVLIHDLEGVKRLKAAVYIDASFHGTVAVGAGCSWVKGDEYGVVQPGTLMFRLINVDLERFGALTRQEKLALGEQGAREGALFTNAILCRPVYPGLSYCNMSRVQVDATVPDSLTQGEMEGRRQVHKILAYLQRSVPGFQRAELAGTGAHLGLRDSRRIVGNHCLTAQEVLSSRPFHDSVAVSSYPIDIHDANGVDSVIQRPVKGNYHIPYRCMTTQVPNLIVTGRCISTDHAAHAAIRVMATCIQLGDAAGLAASKSLELGVPAGLLDGTMIHKLLF